MINKLTTNALLLTLPLLGLAACGRGSTDKDSETKRQELGKAEVVEPVEDPVVQPIRRCNRPGVSVAPDAQLCPPDRLVGYFPQLAECPSPYEDEAPSEGDRWLVERLFAGSPSTSGPDADSPLGHYCRYVWSGTSEPPPLPAQLVGQLGPDCRVFAQSPMAGGLAPYYQKAFSEGTQAIDSQAPLPGGDSVTLAVIDTAPPVTKNGQATHGRAIAAIAAELASGCVPGLGDGDCQRQVTTTLGLPQTRSGANPVAGGYFGYQSELAEGILAAIDAWPSLGDKKHKLIINLAVGWEPKPDDFSSPTPAVRAVREALALAECRGALIVAASGNRPQGTCLGQPTGPGAWAKEQGWTATQCEDLGLSPEQIELPSPLHGHHPFLHAATPLDWDRGNLADFREGSNARIAATGFAGFDTCGGERYGPMSGSSVSTAVVSGIAALVWSYFPKLSADALMQLIYDSGAPTSRTASLALPQTGQSAGPQQRQVSACRALTFACTNWQAYATAQPSVCNDAALRACSGTTPQIDVAAWSAGFDQVLGTLTPAQLGRVQAPQWTTLECVGCNNQPRLVELPPGVAAEPQQQLWVLPQPQKSPCPACKIKSDELYLSLDPEYDSLRLVDLSVRLDDAAGASEVLVYDAASLPPLSSTTVQVVQDQELLSVTPGGPPPIRASVQMTFDDNGTITTAGNQISVE